MHPESLSQEIESSDGSVGKLGGESSTGAARGLAGRLWLWWSMLVAGVLLLVFGPPAILVSYLAGRRHWVYPWALFGARNWLRLSGVKVRVRGLERLDPQRSYVFVANHRSFLDTAALFYHLGRRIGVIAKKELLKVPILGYGMGYVNILAIDRSNHERARETMRRPRW
jgi:1-acyl-sn-glycerol-3-phosphate acyltransferase